MESKMTKSFSLSLFTKCFKNFDCFFPHVDPLHVLIYGLKFVFKLKNENYYKIVLQIVTTFS
jgi:hypothetical protein